MTKLVLCTLALLAFHAAAHAQQQTATARELIRKDTNADAVLQRLAVADQAFTAYVEANGAAIAQCKKSWESGNTAPRIHACWMDANERVRTTYNEQHHCSDFATYVISGGSRPWTTASPREIEHANDTLFACEAEGRKALVAITAK